MQILELHQRFRRYCAIEEGLSPQTVLGIHKAINTFVGRTGFCEMNEITEDRLQEYFYEGKERYQWSYWHYMNNYKYLKKFLDWCISSGFLRENPISGLRKPKKPQSLPRRLTYEQAQKILYASFNHNWTYSFERVRNHAIIAVFLFAGLRAKELLNLRIVDVDLRNEVLLVREGKGGKDRYVPIHHKLGYILKRYFAERERLGKQSPYLFVGTANELPLSYKVIRGICRTLSRSTGVGFTAHCLRHTFGSIAVEQNMGIVQLKEIMGHSNIASTMIYLKMSPEGLKSSLNRLELF